MPGEVKTVKVLEGGALGQDDPSLIKKRQTVFSAGIISVSTQIFSGGTVMEKFVPKFYSTDPKLVGEEGRVCVIKYEVAKESEDNRRVCKKTWELDADKELLTSIAYIAKLNTAKQNLKRYLFVPKGDSILMNLEDGTAVMILREPIFGSPRELGMRALLEFEEMVSAALRKPAESEQNWFSPRS